MALIRSLQPTQQLILFGGAVEILYFGTETGDWSLRDASPAMPGYPRPAVVDAVGALANAYGCRIYAPTASAFNAKVVEVSALNKEVIPERLYRGAVADGVALREPGQAFAVSSGDCPTFVLWDSITSAVVAAHAGRDSLVDMKTAAIKDCLTAAVHAKQWDDDYYRYCRAWMDDLEERKDVVTSAIEAMPLPGLHGGNRRFKAFVACGIGPEHYPNPTHTADHKVIKSNHLLMRRVAFEKFSRDCLLGAVTHCRIDLTKIIRQICEELGLTRNSVGSDGIDTYSDRFPDGRYMWHSHRRNADGKRNLVLVIRRR